MSLFRNDLPLENRLSLQNRVFLHHKTTPRLWGAGLLSVKQSKSASSGEGGILCPSALSLDRRLASSNIGRISRPNKFDLAELEATALWRALQKRYKTQVHIDRSPDRSSVAE
jgi:hypothetical protein